MAMAKPCAACGEECSFIFGAQYQHNDKHLIICKQCYDNGYRCYTTQEGNLLVSKIQPPNSIPTRIYWDEGGYVTKTDGSDWTYFDKESNNAM